MTDRRAELEKKKLKLQQLRELKEQRRNDKYRDRDLISDLGLASVPSSTIINTHNNIKSNNSSLSNDINHSNNDAYSGDIKDVDDLLVSVGIIPIKSGQQSNSTVVNSSNLKTFKNESILTEEIHSGTANQTKQTTSHSLSFASFPPISIAPREHVTYEKQTQTISTSTSDNASGSLPNERGGALDYYVLTYDDLGNDEDGDGSCMFSCESDGKPSNHQRQAINDRSINSSLPTVNMVKPATTPQDFINSVHHPNQQFSTLINDQTYRESQQRRQEYKEEERRHLMQTESFKKFLDRAVRITERALSCSNTMDIFVDYTGQVECVDNEDKTNRLRLSLNTYFAEDRWTKGRTITCFDWCSQFPELLVASYNQNDHDPNEPDGICLVWNTKFKKNTPEYVFHCQSPVMSACFAKFHPNLILGGTYSGQVVLWDNRSGRRVPVQRSPLSASVHTHPVYCLKVVGTPNSHNLISISNDGKLCSWSLDMLSQPQETMELCQQKQSRLIAVTSMSFPQADYNNFILGSQESYVYSACRHGAKAGILDVFEGHQGPITSVDFHSAPSTQVDFSHLFLTSSFDWTFKLWSTRDANKLLYSFEDGSDYLYDVRWSPIHPALFATADGLGKLDIWNLNQDTELPVLSTFIDGNPALNRLIWSPNGQQLVVGDDNGKVWVYDVSEQLAFPKSDEWTKFSQTLQEFSNNNVDTC
ncbi:calcium-responsive transactivator [Sarcoptes scabiei]|nr:calcium-responsive transactivator [Sarcoptes scabiei]